MSSVEELTKGLQKEYGDGTVVSGDVIESFGRIATTIFPFDLATGGGFPEGKISIVYGPESSLKTTIALKAIAAHQRRHPEKVCVFVDLEASYEEEWAIHLGVITSRVKIVRPDFAEQAVDIMESLLYAEDLGIMVIDSLAALITANEVDSSANKAVVGGSGLVINRLYRKATLALNTARKEGRTPTLIVINQIRHKIGVMYGDPETMPGGNAFKFASALTVRLYGKDEMDKKISSVLPVWKICSGIIKKFKQPIAARSFEFKLSVDKSTGLAIGEVDDWATILAYLKEAGFLEKDPKAGWKLFDETYKTQNEIRQLLREDLTFADMVRGRILGAVMDVVESEEAE